MDLSIFGGAIMTNDVILHYDNLIDENNDPVNDPQPLKEYMDKWDGQLFIDKMQLDSNKTVLEIGVGTGRIAIRVAALCKEFTGIDISPKTIVRAKEHLSEYNNVNLICGNFNEFEFNDSFDVIYSSLTFMHIENKQSTINRVYSLLNSDGRFVLSIDKNQDKYIDLGTRKISVYPDNPKDTKSYLEYSGFSIEEIIEAELAYIFVAKK